MDELDRLFRVLVRVLAADDRERLRVPFQVSELYQTFLPYRAFRRELRFDAIEDYEMAILRLLAGQRNYASLEPTEAQQALALEAESVNPDTSAFRGYAAASVTLNQEAARGVLDEHSAYAPPPSPPMPRTSPQAPEPPAPQEPAPEDELHPAADDTSEEPPEYTPPTPDVSPPAGGPDPESAATPVFEAIEVTEDATMPITRCPDCGGVLPSHRTAVFCPYCARQLSTTKCRDCGDDVEPGWQYCVTCGRPVVG
jgi:hypothetical protein